MGLHDAEEMLEAAKADVVQLEREVAKLRAVIARVADHGGKVVDQEQPYVDHGERVSIGRSDVAREVLALVDGAADPNADLSPLSSLSVNGRRLTWQEVAIDREQRLMRLEGFATMLADLDRSRAGRHEGDVEGGAVSLGNPHLSTGQTIGYAIGGRWAYVVPEPRERGNLEAWKQPRP